MSFLSPSPRIGGSAMRTPPPLLIALLLALSVVALVALGVWQLGRFFEKGDLEAERDARIAAPPLTLDGSAAARSPQELDYRRVAVTGRWDHERALTVTGRIRFGLRGEEVVEPLIRDGGGDAILVNRGWYPLTERERVLADLARTPRATVVGLARAAAGGSASETRPGVWTRYDVLAMAGSLPYAVEPWALIEGDLLEAPLRVPPRELPVQGYVGYENAVPHGEYAATWFGLALALTVTAYFRLLRRRPGGP